MAKGFERDCWEFATFESDDEMLRDFMDNGEIENAITVFLCSAKDARQSDVKGV